MVYPGSDDGYVIIWGETRKQVVERSLALAAKEPSRRIDSGPRRARYCFVAERA